MDKQRWKWSGVVALLVAVLWVSAVVAVVWLSAPVDVPQEVKPFTVSHNLPVWVTVGAVIYATVDVMNPTQVRVDMVFLWLNATCVPDPSSPPMTVNLTELDLGGNVIAGPYDICANDFVTSPRTSLGLSTVSWFLKVEYAIGWGPVTWTLQAGR